MELFLPREEDIDIFDQNYINVGFQIKGSTKSRNWKNEYWIDLAYKILRKYRDSRIYLLGSIKDSRECRLIKEQVPDERVADLSGNYDIVGAANIIKELSVLVTVDTGPLHIAAALKVPTVAFSVAGKSKQSNPVDESVRHVFIEKPETCIPCLDKKCKNAFCMDQIKVNDVMNELTKILLSK